MMNFLRELFTPTVSKTLAAYNKTLAKLEKVAAHHDAKNLELLVAAEAAKAKAALAQQESELAKKIKARFEKLFD
jgi:hypothetical protein